MIDKSDFYLMENVDEETRLEWKTDPDDVRKQAGWCGIKPGMRVLDAGCGTGKTASILFDMVQPGGSVLGIDFSDRRLDFAREKYGRPGLEFRKCDLTKPLEGIGKFDFIWIRFVLEYFRAESRQIVKHLTDCLNPGGRLCLLDLDHNSINHYELPPGMEEFFFGVMRKISEDFNFDPYCGRKLYSFLYDLGFSDIRMDVIAHHLIFGKIRDVDAFNWLKKLQVSAKKVKYLFAEYQGGYEAFAKDFNAFFTDPRRFTYTPLIICTGIKNK
jgi:SAM-dependent methyltransferase